MGYKSQLAEPDLPSMKQAAHDLAMEYLSSDLEALDYKPRPDWLRRALGKVDWTKTEQWRRDASKAETALIRNGCRTARDQLTNEPPDIADARAHLIALQLAL